MSDLSEFPAIFRTAQAIDALVERRQVSPLQCRTASRTLGLKIASPLYGGRMDSERLAEIPTG